MHVMSRDERDECDHHLAKVKLRHRAHSRAAATRRKNTVKLLRRNTTGAYAMKNMGTAGKEERGMEEPLDIDIEGAAGEEERGLEEPLDVEEAIEQRAGGIVAPPPSDGNTELEFMETSI